MRKIIKKLNKIIALALFIPGLAFAQTYDAHNVGRMGTAQTAVTTGLIPILQNGKLQNTSPANIATANGTVVGPASSTDNAIVRFDSTTGKLVQNSAATVADTTGAITIPGTTNQLVLGTTNTTTISAVAPSASRVVSLQDPGADANFVTTQGAQTLVGVKTFTNQPVLSAGLSSADSLTMSVANKGIVLKQGANGRVGSFVCNQTTPVNVANTAFAITDAVIISLNTVGGTVGAIPRIVTTNVGTGFAINCTASDTSTYNYALISNAP